MDSVTSPLRTESISDPQNGGTQSQDGSPAKAVREKGIGSGPAHLEGRVGPHWQGLSERERRYLSRLVKDGDHEAAASYAGYASPASVLGDPKIRRCIGIMAPCSSQGVNARMIMPYVLDALNLAAQLGDVQAAKLLITASHEKRAIVGAARPWAKPEEIEE